MLPSTQEEDNCKSHMTSVAWRQFDPQAADDSEKSMSTTLLSGEAMSYAYPHFSGSMETSCLVGEKEIFST